MSIVQTQSARMVDTLAPKSGSISIDDVAKQLTAINRWAGASKILINVAQHSMCVARILIHEGHPPSICLAGLLHDAHEVYMGDVLGPVKAYLGEDFYYFENELQFNVLRALFPKNINVEQFFVNQGTKEYRLLHHSIEWKDTVEKADQRQGWAEALLYMPDPKWVKEEVPDYVLNITKKISLTGNNTDTTAMLFKYMYKDLFKLTEEDIK